MDSDSPDITDTIAALQQQGAVLIRGCRSQQELTQELQSAIDAGKPAIVQPTTKSRRLFFNPSGFRMVMQEVLDDLTDCQLVILPDCYGTRLFMAIAPRTD